MSDTDTTEVNPTTVIDPPKPPLRDRLLVQALRERQNKIETEQIKAERDALEAEAIAFHKEHGLSGGWSLFDGDTQDRAALVTVKSTTTKVTVTDRASFTDFVMAHLPAGSVEVITQVRSEVEKGLFKDPILDDDENVLWVNKATGDTVPIPGVKYVKGGDPTSISFGQLKTDILDRMLARLSGENVLTAGTEVVLSTAIEAGDDK